MNIALPDDGKRKKAVVRQTLSTLIYRYGGFEQIKAAVFNIQFCFMAVVEETAMEAISTREKLKVIALRLKKAHLM